MFRLTLSGWLAALFIAVTLNAADAPVTLESTNFWIDRLLGDAQL